MSYLKRVVIFTLLCLIIASIISLFLPSEIDLNKSGIIDADKNSVEKQLKTFSFQTVGGYEVLESEEIWDFVKVDDGLQVSSSVVVSLGFNPVTKFSALFNRTEIELDFQRKFDSVKLVLEELPKIQGVDVEQKMMENDIWFLSIRDTINQKSMNNVHGRFYEEIKIYLSENQEQEVVSPPIVIYHFWSDTLIDIEVGISVKDSTIETGSRIALNKIKKTNVVTAVHYGAYERLPETYFGINEWMRKNKVFVTGPPWEVYLTDPSTEANPKKWETAIYFPIE